MKSETVQSEAPPAVAVQRSVRRRLIVDFFKLGPLSRWDVCDKGRWLTESDLRLLQEAPDQDLWALAFERAEQRGELDMMRKYVDAETPNDQAQRPPPETPGRLQQSRTNYPNRPTAQRGGGSLQRSG